MKQCPCCGETKTIDKFPVDVRRRDGRGSYCLICHYLKYTKYLIRRVRTSSIDDIRPDFVRFSKEQWKAYARRFL